MLVLDDILSDVATTTITLNTRKCQARPLALRTQMDIESAFGGVPEAEADQGEWLRKCQAVACAVAAGVGFAVKDAGRKVWDQLTAEERPAWAEGVAKQILATVTLGELNASHVKIANPVKREQAGHADAAARLKALADEVKAAGSEGPAWGNAKALKHEDLHTALRMAADEFERRSADGAAVLLEAAKAKSRPRAARG